MSIQGPYPFARQDLEPTRLAAGVQHTLAHYYHWRDTNPGAVAAHVNRYTDQLAAFSSRHRLPYRLVSWGRRRNASREQIAREVNHFGVYNLSEILEPATIERITDGVHRRTETARATMASIDKSSGVNGLVDSLEQHIPALKGIPEMRWLAGRLDRLHRILPEAVVQAGSMGKVFRTMAGVLAIGAVDTLDESPAARAEHLTRILPAAYAYGATYAIIDDTLQDLPGDYISPADKERYHQMIVKGLTTGQPMDAADLPDHPLAEELNELFTMVLASHPFDDYRHLYHAAESMYLAQHRDAALTREEVLSTGLANMYPDVFIKAGMSRVVANILGRRTLDSGFYARCFNTIFLSQLKDDLADRGEDGLANRLTPFTFPADRADVNPLYDLFAYDAYVAAEVFKGDPAASEALTHFGAVKLATHLTLDRRHADELMRNYEVTPEIARFLRAASALPARAARHLASTDIRLKRSIGQALKRRNQTELDSRTFVADRLRYINEVVGGCYPQGGGTELDEIVRYTMDGSGKRLRPALTLMLAEGLAVDYASTEPLLAAVELFHTSSLIFDDLPAQDNAAVRRGKPTAHTVFDEASVQLAAISMLSSGFGVVAKLSARFPAHRVTEVIAYVGSVLGPERLCRGQHLDLHLGTDGVPITEEAILEMYSLKTSTMIEAALVPLMMLLDRPPAEIAAVKQYAYHAGIVFQLRDDILDATSATARLGKDAGNDVGKVNVVRVSGLAEARGLMQTHLDRAISECVRLPFDTNLLKGVVEHFATRNR